MDALPFHEHTHVEAEEEKVKEDAKLDEEIQEELFDYRPVEICGSWFEEKIPADSNEELTITKFKAHAAYKRKNYQQALSLYKTCAKLLPSNANLVLREVGESQARCLLNLGRLEDCEQLLLSLLKEKGNPQDSSLKALLSDVYVSLGKLDDAARYLRQCLTLHPEYAKYWVKIAAVFELLAKSIPCFIKHCSKNDNEELEAFTDTWYFVEMLKKCFFAENNKENKEKNLDFENQVILCNYERQELLGFTWEKFNKDICIAGTDSLLNTLNSLLSTECTSRENIIHTRDCNCFEIGFGPSSLTSYLNGEGHQESFPSLNDISLLHSSVPQLESTEHQQLVTTHFCSWYQIMLLSHWLALGKAWQLLRKTVQYSKGFAKEIEQKQLSEINQRLVNGTGCQGITDWLTKAHETSSPAGKQIGE